VIERPGIFASLSRSGELTRGSRWQIFGLILILFLARSIIGGVIMLLAPKIGVPHAAVVVNFLWQAVAGSFGAVVAAVVYHDLRVSMEGIDAGQIASVFD
jgi:hypothetical protein